MVSWSGCGLLACASAIGPTCLGRKGAATLAIIKLARTETGSTFSCIFAAFKDSGVPNTTCCTLLKMRRHFRNEVE